MLAPGQGLRCLLHISRAVWTAENPRHSHLGAISTALQADPSSRGKGDSLMSSGERDTQIWTELGK